MKIQIDNSYRVAARAAAAQLKRVRTPRRMSIKVDCRKILSNIRVGGWCDACIILVTIQIPDAKRQVQVHKNLRDNPRDNGERKRAGLSIRY